jgi:S1-C subfamily serine protease
VIDPSRHRGAIALSPRRLALRKAHLLQEIRRVAEPERRALWVALAAAVVVLTAAGTGFAVGAFDWLTQQNQFDSPGPGGPPPLVGKRVVFASGASWAAIAWRGIGEGLCIDVATQGHIGNACGLPVADAASPREPTSNLRLAAGVTSGSGAGYLLSAGVTVPQAARVDVELADGRVVRASIADAPAQLETEVRLFWVRFAWSLPVGLGHRVIERYLVYDRSGARIGAAPG